MENDYPMRNILVIEHLTIDRSFDKEENMMVSQMKRGEVSTLVVIII